MPLQPAVQQQLHPLIGTVYPTIVTAETALRKEAEDRGYAICRFDTQPNRQDPKRVVFACQKHGVYRSRASSTDEAKRRRVKTQKTNCPFKIAAKTKKSHPGWTVEEVNSERSGEHNHVMFDRSAYAGFRTRALRELRGEIIQYYNDGQKPSEIAKMLRTEGDPRLKHLQVWDINNLITRHKQGEFEGEET
jgi:hypothetical protein